MIRFACVVGASIVLLAAARPGQAGLYIERLEIGALADTNSNNEVKILSDPLTPLGSPLEVQATLIDGRVAAIAYQSKTGFFRNRTSINQGSLHNRIEAAASSLYFLVVGTDTPDTPLILDFQFLGAETRGSSYFGFGSISAVAGQTISATRIADPAALATLDPMPQVWGIGASVTLANGMWSHSYTTLADVQNIGEPVATITPGMGSEPNGEFEFRNLKLELDAFNGRLDFGLLQPGEYFALRYTANAYVHMHEAYEDLGPEAYAFAELTDPFSLGGGAPPQLSLAGLTLPAVPEPSTGLLSLAAMAICAARRRGKDRGDRQGRAA